MLNESFIAADGREYISDGYDGLIEVTCRDSRKRVPIWGTQLVYPWYLWPIKKLYRLRHLTSHWTWCIVLIVTVSFLCVMYRRTGDSTYAGLICMLAAMNSLKIEEKEHGSATNDK